MLGDVSHVGVIVDDLESAVTRWTEVLGFLEVDRLDVPEEGVRSVYVSAGPGRGEGPVIELISPIDPDDRSGAIARRLADDGPGLFHLAVFADDPAAEAQRLRDAGLTVYDIPPAGDAAVRAVIHPRSADGVLIEILARP